MELGLIISAFIAGIITFLAPCTLPLVPAYLGFISGVDVDSIHDKSESEKKQLKRKVIKNGLFFVLGFSIIFIVFGVLAGLFGAAITEARALLTQIAGVFVIIFGLFMLGVFKLKFLQRERKIKLPATLTKGNPKSSLIIGGAFGLGWSPCVGPILASILLLASSSSTAFQAAFMLAVFSLGLAIPFMLVAFFTTKSMGIIRNLSKTIQYASIVGGVFLIGLGILLLLNDFTLLIEWGYELFDFIDYQRLESYL